MKHIIHFILLSIFLFTNQLNANEASAKSENDIKQIYDIGGHFKLTDQNRKIFESAKATQPYLLVFFGYGTCKSTCPTALHELTNFMKQNTNFIKKVQPVFISLEPSKDTPEKLKRFGKPYDQNITMLTSTEENKEEYIKNLIHQYKIYSATINLSEKEKKELNEEYVIEHTSIFYLISKKTGYLVKPVASNVDAMNSELKEYK